MTVSAEKELQGSSISGEAYGGEGILSFSHVATGYGEKKIIKDVSLNVNKGDFIGLIGSNGTGKSTLIKCVSGLLTLMGGSIKICGRDHASLKPKERAQMVAVVPQSYNVDYDFYVEDIVMMGRNPYTSFRHRNLKEDEEIVAKAMEMTNTEVFRGRMYNELSGGERQRVIIARAIAQQPDIILLDEPTSALDVRHATEVMELIARLNKEEHMTVLAVIHDINMAAKYCTRMVLLGEGYVKADGTPAEVVNRVNMEKLYEMRLLIRENPIFEKPEMVPIRILNETKAPVPHRIHFICGDNTAVRMMEELANRGHRLTAGVVSPYSGDGEMCRFLEIPVVTGEPYGEVTPQEQEQNLKLMSDADYIIVSDMPFGSLNIECLRGIEHMSGRICLHRALFEEEHDYTGGILADLLVNLRSTPGCIIYDNTDELLSIIDAD